MLGAGLLLRGTLRGFLLLALLLLRTLLLLCRALRLLLLLALEGLVAPARVIGGALRRFFAAIVCAPLNERPLARPAAATA